MGSTTDEVTTSVVVWDQQTVVLGGLISENVNKIKDKVPVLGDVPVLGSLFRSKNFQKNETELIFIVTAQLVKPMNRDDLPQMRGVDGLKNGSPLGLEPKGEEIQGRTGFSVTGQNNDLAPAAPKIAEPAKPVEPVVDPKAKSGTETGTGSTTGASSNAPRKLNPALPVALTTPTDFSAQPLKP